MAIHKEIVPPLLDPIREDSFLSGYKYVDKLDSFSSRKVGRLYQILFDLAVMSAESATPIYVNPGQTIVRSSDGDLYSTLGSSYTDFTEITLPLCLSLGQDVIETHGDGEVSRTIIASMLGTIVAQGQMFATANKRVARSIYGYMLSGVSGVRPAYESVIDFDVDAEIERTVLEQNIARYMSEEYGKSPIGGIYVDGDLSRLLATLCEQRATFIAQLPPAPYFQGSVDKADHHFSEAIESDDTYLIQRFTGAFCQKHYGIGALALSGLDFRGSISQEDAQKFCEINKQLLNMRLASIATALSVGGKFIAIEDSDEEMTARKIKEKIWQPRIMSSKI